MTAEIVLMNRDGIAMAADSAVTIGDGRKIYNSANKLFSLTKTGQVGIMVYGTSSFMNIPFETVIKVYREVNYGKDFSKLENYAEEFLHYLSSENQFENLEIEKENIKYLTFKMLNVIIDNSYLAIEENFEDVIPSNQDKLKVLKSEFEEFEQKLLSYEYLEDFDIIEREIFSELYRDEIYQVTYKLIGDVEGKASLQEQMFNNVYEYIHRENFEFSSSGIVIAGFGRNDILPKLISFELDGLYNNNLRYRITNDIKISPILNSAENETTGVIVPFAQQEMVHSFISGIHPHLKNYIGKALEDIFSSYPSLLKKYINENKIDLDVDIKMIEVLGDINSRIIEGFESEFSQDIYNHHIDPLINNLQSLPKEELAEMAKALVNITSLKRRVTNNAETVGGPVDVAVISKGDGFIWIDRKHYFEPKYNHSFFENYFREEKINEDFSK